MTCWADEERRRAEAMSDAQQRQRFLASRLLLREQIATQVGDACQSLSLRILPHGKPVLRDVPGPQFNLAHTGAFWLLGMTAFNSVGVDLERVRPLSHMSRLAQRVFSAGERDELESIKDESARQAAFFRGWTRKEAALKAIGTGFSRPASELHLGLDHIAERSCLLEQGKSLFVYSGVTSDALYWAIATDHPISSLQMFRLMMHEPNLAETVG